MEEAVRQTLLGESAAETARRLGVDRSTLR